MGRRNFKRRREGAPSRDDRNGNREESSGAQTKTARMANHRYGVDADLDELRQIQRIERTYGVRRLKRWLGEGMPYEAMGNPHTMERFRERKGTPVPWDVEAKNEESLQRSRRAIQRGPRSGETQVPDAVRDVISAPGQSLDPPIQRAMEDRMGDSFGDVQIHTGPQAAEACDAINARAFTVGNHVAFDHGEYDPGSAEGQHVIAHELAHVRQQTGGRLSMLPKEELALEIDPDPALEREAEETAQRVMSGGELGIQRMGRSNVHVQRMFGSLNPFGSSSSAGGETSAIEVDEVPRTVEGLAQEVRDIKTRMAKLSAAQADEGMGHTLGKAAAKGAIGTAGGLAGAAVGTMIAPGAGTAAGAVAGQEIFKELGSGIAGDVTKAAFDPVFDAGSQAITEKSSDFGEYVDELVEEKVRKRLGGSEHGGASQGVGEGGNV